MPPDSEFHDGEQPINDGSVSSVIYDVGVVGLGPNGVRALKYLKRKGLSAVGFDKGSIGTTIRRWHIGAIATASWEELALGPYAADIAQVWHFCGDQADITGLADACDRDAYIRYMEAAVSKARLLVRQHEEVVDIQSLGQPGSDSHVFQIATIRAEDGALSKTHARLVLLAVGNEGVGKGLGMRGSELPHVITHELVQSQSYAGVSAVIVGGTHSETAAQVSRELCLRGAKQVVICDYGYRNLSSATGTGDRGTITSWARERYNVTDWLYDGEMEWYDRFFELIQLELRTWRERGVLMMQQDCEVSSINASHATLNLSVASSVGSPGSVDGSTLWTTAADLVIAAIGGVRDQPLLTAMGFPSAAVSAATGETSLAGVFAVGFDLPGQKDHDSCIYDNWFSWGLPAVLSTCEAVVSRIFDTNR